jgi:hypothetical protein
MQIARFQALSCFLLLALGYSALQVTVVQAQTDTTFTVHMAAPVGEATAYRKMDIVASSWQPRDYQMPKISVWSSTREL